MASASNRDMASFSTKIRPIQPITEFRTPYGTVSRTRSRTRSISSKKNHKNGYLGNNERESPTRKRRVFRPFPNEDRRKEAVTLAKLAKRQNEFEKFLIQQREAASARRNTRLSPTVNESFLKYIHPLPKTHTIETKISNSPSIFRPFRQVINPTGIQGGTRKKRRSGTAKNLIRS